MTAEQEPDFLSILTPEHLSALTEEQKSIFSQLDEKDRLFFSTHFSPESLGKALQRKWQTMQSNARLAAFDQRVKENIAVKGTHSTNTAGISAGEAAIGVAGVAGAIGIGVLARKIAPQGKATWRGVKPIDFLDPLTLQFARQRNTDIRFDAPNKDGVIHANILLRTSNGLVPALDIVMAPLQEKTRVEISKLSSASVLGAVKDSSGKLVSLLADGVIRRRRGPGGLIDMAGKVIDKGGDILQTVNDLDLEDRAWETIQRAADPIQKRFDEQVARKRERQMQLELLWDDYYACPKCRVEFSADDTDCRVCSSARPPQPEQPDPRRSID
jgi:hypothetical protein